MGRHTAPPDIARRRRRIAAASGVVLLVAVASYGAVWALGDGESATEASPSSASATTPAQAPECLAATVAAPGDILPVVQERAATVTGDGGCRLLAVTEGTATTVANTVGSDGAAQAWVSDSPAWLAQMAPALNAKKVTSSTGEVFATSPVVLAVPAGIAGPMNTGVRPWMTALSVMPLASASPSANTASGLAFVAVWQQLRNNPVAGAAMGDAFFRIIRESPSQDELLAQNGTQVKAFPASEQQLASLTAQGKAGAMRAMVPAEGTPSLEYALTRFGTLDEDATGALDRLDAALRDEAGVAALQKAGFRVGGQRGVQVADVPAEPASVQVDDSEFTQIVRDWTYVNRDLRLLMAVDVSGSMLAKAGDTRRIDLAVTAVQEAVKLMQPTSDAGLWVFSTAQRGRLDYRLVTPVRPIGEVGTSSSHAATLVRDAARMPTFISGDTGLNDTIFAAFSTMQRGYAPDRDNLIVVLTDGRNDDSTGGLSTDQLIARLKAAADPQRPVRVVVVGMGTKDDQAVMTRVTSQVGGRAYYVTDPAQIPAAFANAIWTINRPAG